MVNSCFGWWLPHITFPENERDWDSLLRTPRIPNHQTTFVRCFFCGKKHHTCPQLNPNVDIHIYSCYILSSFRRKNKMSFIAYSWTSWSLGDEICWYWYSIACLIYSVQKYQQTISSLTTPVRVGVLTLPTLRGKRTHWHIAWTSEVLISVEWMWIQLWFSGKGLYWKYNSIGYESCVLCVFSVSKNIDRYIYIYMTYICIYLIYRYSECNSYHIYTYVHLASVRVHGFQIYIQCQLKICTV